MSTTPLPLPLPRAHGPRLEPFRGTASADVDFLAFFGNDKDVDSKVWKVRNDKNIYALKIENSEDVAIRTYGYILLTREQERDVTEALGADYVDWEDHPDYLDCAGVFPRWEDHRHERLRAIVKDYVAFEDSMPWAPSQIPQMYADLEKLHELGILFKNIHQGKYLSGKLVDFSKACTMYHPCLDRVTPSSIQKLRLDEPEKFENMINEWAFNKDQEIEEFIPFALVMESHLKDTLF